MQNENNIFTELGLTLEQTEILYNLYRLKTKSDINSEKNTDTSKVKVTWLNKWEKAINDIFAKQFDIDYICWMDESELAKKISDEVSLSPSKIWIHLAVLETTVFAPYYVLEVEETKNKKIVLTKQSKEFQKLKFNAGNAWLINFLNQHNFVKSGFIDDVEKSYKKALNR